MDLHSTRIMPKHVTCIVNAVGFSPVFFRACAIAGKLLSARPGGQDIVSLLFSFYTTHHYFIFT
jgi:hypothetical protein